MLLSRSFLPILKEDPKEAQIVSHRLMLRAGMIRQTAAGIYAWLPLGFKVLKKIEQIVREEQDKAGALEMLMPTLQPAELWQKSGRYDAYGKEMLRIKDRHDRDLLYGPTNEEMLTDIFQSVCKSYKDLPKQLYHIQWKFRDEIRPRFGLMRGREFLMKDNYSFDLTYEGAKLSYQTMFLAYLKTFNRLGIKAIPMRADTGPIGGNMSHEFIILAETGESAVFCDEKLMDICAAAETQGYGNAAELDQFFTKWTAPYAATDEMHDAATCSVPESDLLQARGIEVGHIFYFGTKYSESMEAYVMNPEGKQVAVEMGSYGIGVSRLVAAIIEASHDENGIIWPMSVAPYDVVLVNLRPDDEAGKAYADELYASLKRANIDVLYDDLEDNPGTKFSRADLLGIPYQIVVGPRGLKEGTVELKERKSGNRETISKDEIFSAFMAKHNHGITSLGGKAKQILTELSDIAFEPIAASW